MSDDGQACNHLVHHRACSYPPRLLQLIFSIINLSIINLSLAREHKGKVRWAAISREGDMALTCGQVDIVGTFFSLDIM